MRRSLGLLLGLLGAALAGCEARPDPTYGWWTPVCVATHPETYPQVTTVPTGVPLGGGLHVSIQTRVVCDRREWRCPEGRDCPDRIRPAEPPAPD